MATGEMKLIKSETIDLLSQNQESEALEASGGWSALPSSPVNLQA